MANTLAQNTGKNPLNAISLLVVDDDERFLKLLKNVLISFGFHNIHLAEDGEQAKALITSHSYDLIITDWKMEPISGHDLVYFLRNDPASKDFLVPVIMLSGMAERHHVEKARDVGITEFLAKPFTVETLRNRIAAVFERPREFIFSSEYSGPDRRRRKSQLSANEERRRED